MGNTAIRVENLGKMYRIGGAQEPYGTFRDAITRVTTSPFRKVRDLLRGQAYGAAGMTEEIWALKDVSFEVKHGEIVGIIGRNGAGKSTLLKILSRITEPTTGYADVYGRVGALLEVGTGFHPELTGRENVYLNGAILGMSRRDIERKFDEIVDFAGIEKFIDTPVKYYSSGMGLRLGFAVAAHLEPEILVVDEVLAVGDAQFQKKCLGKMSDVAGEGRTVLFVSHNMGAVENLCKRGIVLSQGEVLFEGTQTGAIGYYFQNIVEDTSTASLSRRKDREGNGLVRFMDIEYRNDLGNPIDTIPSGSNVDICLSFETNEALDNENIQVGITLRNSSGVAIFSQSTRVTKTDLVGLPSNGKFVCRLKHLPLPPSIYYISINVKVDEVYADYLVDAAHFTVVEGDYFGSGRSFPSNLGVCFVNGTWHIETTPLPVLRDRS